MKLFSNVALRVLALTAAMAAYQCIHGAGEKDGGQSLGEGKGETADRMSMLVIGNTAFGLELHRRLAESEENLVISPFSISSALAMTWAGARGETARQMKEVLSFPPAETTHESFRSLLEALREPGEDGDNELVVSNALWGQNDFQFVREFREIVENSYHARFEEVDFRRDVEAVRREINAWVEEETRERITELVPAGALGELTRLVLTNAVYFKGAWASPFPEHQTQEADFSRLDGSDVQVDMMQETGYFPYAEADGVQVLELPYEANETSMLLLLPAGRDGLPALEESLTAERLAEWVEALEGERVEVKLPKFRVTSDVELGAVLQEMGMAHAFDSSGADFSGMAENADDLHISAVLHQTFVDVHEEGTEAAAATAVGMEITSVPTEEPVAFHADRPFLFFLRHRDSGSILFLGRVADPGKQG